MEGMKAHRPSWVSHETFPIFSVDIQPGSLRFATGGGDGFVKIWSTAALLDPTLELHSALREPLYTGTLHDGGVRCVRWSTGGRFLATGGLEGSVVICMQRPGAPPRAFAQGSAASESWPAVFLLKCHTMEVQDVAWCPGEDDDIEVPGVGGVGPLQARARAQAGMEARKARPNLSKEARLELRESRSGARPPMLASCSMDNRVCVWALVDPRLGTRIGAGDGMCSEPTGPAILTTPLLTLTGHESWVQSVAWDPLGHFLASFSDDRSVQVWRTSVPAGGNAAAALRRAVFGAPEAEVELLQLFGKRKRGRAGTEDEEEGEGQSDVSDESSGYSDEDDEDEGDTSAAALLEGGRVGWHEVDFVNVPFNEGMTSAPLRRADYTADGAALAASHGKVAGRLTVPLIARPDRDPILHLCGHVRPVVAVRGSSVLCMGPHEGEQRGAEGSLPQAITFPVIMAGANDKSLSVWAPTRLTPLFVLGNGAFDGPVADLAMSPVPDAASLGALRLSRLGAQLRAASALGDEGTASVLQGLRGVDRGLSSLYSSCAPSSCVGTGGLLMLAAVQDGTLLAVTIPAGGAGVGAGTESSSSSSSASPPLSVSAAHADSALAHMAQVYGLSLSSVLAGEGLPTDTGGTQAGEGQGGGRTGNRGQRGTGDGKSKRREADDDDEEEEEGEDEAPEQAPPVAPVELLAWWHRRSALYGPLAALQTSFSRPVLEGSVYVPDVPLAVLKITHSAGARALQAVHAAQMGLAAGARGASMSGAGAAGASPGEGPGPMQVEAVSGGRRRIAPMLVTVELMDLDMGPPTAPPPSMNDMPPPPPQNMVFGSAFAGLLADMGMNDKPPPPQSEASLHSTRLEARLSGGTGPLPLPLLRRHPWAADNGRSAGTVAVTWGMRRLVRAQREGRTAMLQVEATRAVRKAEQMGDEDKGQGKGEAAGVAEVPPQYHDAVDGAGAGMLGLPLHFFGMSQSFAEAPESRRGAPVLPIPPALPRITCQAINSPAAPSGALAHDRLMSRGVASATLMSIVDPALAALQAEAAEAMDELDDESKRPVLVPTYFTCTNLSSQVESWRGVGTVWTSSVGARATVLMHIPHFLAPLLIVGCADGSVHVLQCKDGSHACRPIIATTGGLPIRDLAFAMLPGQSGPSSPMAGSLILATLGCDGILSAWTVRPAIAQPPVVQLTTWCKAADVGPVLLAAVSSLPEPERAAASVTLGGLAIDARGDVSVQAFVAVPAMADASGAAAGGGGAIRRTRAAFVWDRLADRWSPLEPAARRL